MKAIVLAGGSGTRLYPATRSVSKQLLPIYDKPTIYYPISVMMLAGIRQILIISTPRDLPLIEQLFGNGSQFGLELSYLVQPNPGGIAQAFTLGKKFVGDSPCGLILGDNIFYGADVSEKSFDAAQIKTGARIFGYRVGDPERYGVAEIDAHGKVLSIEEKPKKPKSNWAVTGLYFYDHTVCERAEQLKPSPRGEIEITDLNMSYLKDQQLQMTRFGRGTAWLDTGTHESLISSSIFVQTIEQKQGLKIACLEEIAWRKGYIQTQDFKKLAQEYPKSSYGDYLRTIVETEM